MRLAQIVKPLPEINMIPMIDVIMMLLIFFLVATQMKGSEAGSVQLAESERAAASVAEEKGPMTVNIRPASDAGDRPYELSPAGPLTRSELTAVMREYVLTRRDGETPVVRIRADRDSELRHLQGLLICCRDVGVYKVLLATVAASPAAAHANVTTGGN